MRATQLLTRLKAGLSLKKSQLDLLDSPLTTKQSTDLAEALTYSQNTSVKKQVLAALESNPPVLTTSNTLRYMQLLNWNQYENEGLLEAWWKQILGRDSSSAMISRFLATLINSYGEEDKYLQLEHRIKRIKIGSSKSLAHLIYFMAKHYFRFSPDTFEAVLELAKHRIYTPEDLARLAYGIAKSTLNPMIAGNYLTQLSSQVASKLKHMSAEDRGLVVYAYSTVRMQCSGEIVTGIADRLDFSRLFMSDLLHIVSSLDQYPVEDDIRILEHIGSRLEARAHIQPQQLVTLVHAFAKRGAGSPELFRIFQAAAETYKYDRNSLDILHYSFLLSPHTSQEFKERIQAKE